MLDSSPDAPYIEIALEEIDGGLQKASLIIDLKTAKSRIAHYIGAAQEEVLTASDNSEFKIAQSNPIFADRLKSLSFILDAKKDTNSYDNQEKQNQEKIIMMRPYQGGDLINLYQEYLMPSKWLRKVVSLSIHCLNTPRIPLNKPLILLDYLIIQEKLLFGLLKRNKSMKQNKS